MMKERSTSPRRFPTKAKRAYVRKTNKPEKVDTCLKDVDNEIAWLKPPPEKKTATDFKRECPNPCDTCVNPHKFAPNAVHIM